MLLIRGKHAKRLFINENDKERKTLCCSMMSKIKKVVLQCLNMKGYKSGARFFSEFPFNDANIYLEINLKRVNHVS